MTTFKPLVRINSLLANQRWKACLTQIRRNFSLSRNMQESNAVNGNFYDALWSESRLIRPERFNTWPLISRLVAHAPNRLEIGPGLRPRLPIPETHFIDISPPAIGQLAAHGGIALTGNCTDLPFSDGKFELVCAFDVIEHTREDGRVLGEISRVLKEGGCFICSVPLYARYWTEFDEFAGHMRRYEPAELQSLLAAHNLELETSAAYGMQPANSRLLDFGLWGLRHRRQEAMWWYNKILMPLGLFFQKKLKFIDGLIEAPGVDEIVLVCRKHIRHPSEEHAPAQNGSAEVP